MEHVPEETGETDSNTDVRDTSSDNLAILRLQEENQTLQEENYYLKHDVDKAEDKVHQLTHELAQKQMLMKLYHKELESVEGKRAEKKGFNWKSTLTCLKTKAKTLEHEKWELTEELESRKAELEAREAKLESLQSSYIRQIENLKTRVSRHEEVARTQEERNAALQAEKDLLREKFNLWAAERERVKQELETRDKQIVEFESREGEILRQIAERQHELDNLRRLYEDRRDEAKRLRMNNMPLNGRPRSRSANDSTCYSSIKDELEESLRREREIESDTQSESSSSFRHSFETAKSTNRHAHFGVLEDGDPFGPQARANAVAMDIASPTFSIGGDSGWGSDEENSVHFPSSADHRRRRGWKYPSRLQLVKPLEGSETLQHWQELATPTLNKLFEPRDGIVSRHEVDTGNHLTVDWSMREQLLSEPEEDDDPEVDDRSSAGPPEISQSLTDDFIKGISCFGVSPRRANSELSMAAEREPMRPRSTSLVEKVKRSGICATERPRVEVRHSAKSLHDEMTPFANCVGFGERRYTLPSASSAAAALGINKFTNNFLKRRQTSLEETHLDKAKTAVEDTPAKTAHPPNKDSFAAQLLNLIGGPFGSEPKVRCLPISQATRSPQHKDSSWKISTRDDKVEKRSKLKIKIVKKKTPEFTFGQTFEKPKKGQPNVLHTITSLRKNNLLIGGIGDLPEVPTSPFHESAFIKDITLDIF